MRVYICVCDSQRIEAKNTEAGATTPSHFFIHSMLTHTSCVFCLFSQASSGKADFLKDDYLLGTKKQNWDEDSDEGSADEGAEAGMEDSD